MIVSCLDQQSGLYRYFEEPSQLPINADLPVPRLPDNTRLGTPSLDAARPFPAGAKPIGTGWHARGVIVRCPGEGLGALDLGSLTTTRTALYVALAASGGALAAEMLDKSLGLGALAGAAFGLAAALATAGRV